MEVFIPFRCNKVDYILKYMTVKTIVILVIYFLTFSFTCKNIVIDKITTENSIIQNEWKSERYDWIVSSLSINNENLYFGGLEHNFYCVDLASGRLKWKFKTDEECSYPSIFSEDIVYFTCFDQNLYALNQNGKLLWTFNLSHKVKSSPIVYKQILIVSITSRGVIALNKYNGTLMWELPQDISALSTTQPFISNDILFVGDLNNTFAAISPNDGQILWAIDYVNTILSNPQSSDNIVIFGGFNPIESQNSFINAVDIRFGKIIWNKKLIYNARYRPMIYNGRLYFGNENSEIICLKLENGDEVWRIKLDEDGLGSEILGFQNRLYFSGYNRNLYIIDADSGTRIAKSLVNYGVSNPLFVDGKIFYGSGEGILYKVTN